MFKSIIFKIKKLGSKTFSSLFKILLYKIYFFRPKSLISEKP